MAGGIFISYRRDDSRHAAGRLVDRLAQTFRRDQLFMDVDAIEPGLDFVKVLTEKVGDCDVFLAVIGPQWVNATDPAGQKRLDNPKDFVRIELEAALQRDIRIVPVLVDGAQMPKESELPEPLQPLSRRNAVRLSHERFGTDAAALAASLKRVVSHGGHGRGWPRLTKSSRRSIDDVPTSGELERSREQSKVIGHPQSRHYRAIVVAVEVFAIVVGFIAAAGTTKLTFPLIALSLKRLGYDLNTLHIFAVEAVLLLVIVPLIIWTGRLAATHFHRLWLQALILLFSSTFGFVLLPIPLGILLFLLSGVDLGASTAFFIGAAALAIGFEARRVHRMLLLDISPRGGS